MAPELGSSGLVWQRLRLDAPSARARERSGLGPTASKVTDSTAFGHAGAVFVLCSQHITHPHEPVVSAMPHLIVGIAIVSRCHSRYSQWSQRCLIIGTLLGVPTLILTCRSRSRNPNPTGRSSASNHDSSLPEPETQPQPQPGTLLGFLLVLRVVIGVMKAGHTYYGLHLLGAILAMGIRTLILVLVTKVGEVMDASEG